MSRFRFVCEHRDAYGVKRLCRVLGCSRSGFHAWHGRPPAARRRADRGLLARIEAIHRRSRRTYGAPRIQAELARQGLACGRKRVARLMAEAGLQGAQAPRRRRRGRPGRAVAPDLVGRAFRPSRPDAIWAADISQFPTGEGLLHLACVLDLHSRRLVGWSMGSSPDAALVGDALLAAFARRRPDRVIHHSDHGAAYTSLAFSGRLHQLGIAQSLGSVGDCFDNAPIESFFATLKRELAWIHAGRRWATRAALRTALFDYIEGFYNPIRIQQRLGYLSPAEFERKGAAA